MGEISCCIDVHRQRAGGLVIRGLPDSTHSLVQEEDLPLLLGRSPEAFDSLLQTVQSGLVLFTSMPTRTLGCLTCAVLKRFSSIKCDPGMESVVRMCLDAMALQLLNTQADAAALADHQSFTKASLYDAERNGHHSQENCTDQGATQTPQRPGLSTTRVPLHLQQMVFELGDDHQLQQRQDEQLNADSQKPLQQLGGGKVAQQQQQVQQSGEDPHQIQHHHCDSQPEEQQHNLPRQPWHAPELPLLAHQDLLQLQSHAADFADKDRRDWRINIRFLRLSMQQATWPGPVWPEAELLDMVGRIVSNNFGIYTSRQRQQPHHAHLNAQDDGALAGEASSRSALQGVSSLSSGSTGEEATEKTRGHLLPLPTPKPSSSSQYVTPWPMQADTEQLVRSNSVSPLHGNSTADVCDTQRLFPALDSAVGALSVDGPAQCCTQHSKSSAPRHTEAELSQVQRGRAATGIQKAKEDVIGREMYITASFFNHSCEPNCVKTRVHGQHSGLATVTALRDIKAGEALTISYIDLELPRSARQLELKTSFFFDCKCIRCERELTEGSKKCSFVASQSQRKCQAPKRRGLKARVSRGSYHGPTVNQDAEHVKATFTG
ncbi:hypothetical protein WJX77_008581 [Trebouxia sp. C0004]